MDTSQIGLVTLAATQGIVLFTTLCPDRTTLYQTSPDATTKQTTRQCELVAAVLTLGFAAGLAYFSKSSMPLTLASATVVTMVAAYEYTLHAVPIGDN